MGSEAVDTERWFGGIAVSTVVLPGRQRASALVRLGAAEPRRPVLWTVPGLADLAAALDHVAGLDAESVVLTGNDHSFGSGADLTQLAAVASAAEGERVANAGWRAFRALADLPVPSFALISGFALGGGLELALFADHRLARSDTSGIGLPEVGLGLLPGWGGAWRIGRLAGPEVAITAAVEDSLKGRTLTAEQALERGIVDAVLPAAGWDAAWPAWVAARTDNGKRTDPVSGPARAWAQAVDEAARRLASARPAPSVAALATVALIRGMPGQDVDAAQAETAREFGRLLYSNEARAGIHAQLLQRRRPAIPDRLAGGVARPIRRAAIIGAGLMAAQLAALIARHARTPVLLTDLDQARADQGVAMARDRLARLARRGTLSPDEAVTAGGRLAGSADMSAIAGADFVVEAIFEDLDAKRAAFAAAEPHLAPDAILATNTSSLSITRMAEGLTRPERLIGFHVFNPVDTVPLLEVIPGRATSPDATATALEFGRVLKRSAVLSADAPGFIVNRLLTRLFDVLLRAIDAGQDPDRVNCALDPLGLPMTPLQLLDFVGTAVQLHVSETMQAAYPGRFASPTWLTHVVEAGLRAVLDADGRLSEPAAALLPPRAELQESGSALLDRVLLALAEESRLMLDEGVVAEAADLDFAMLLGANWPRTLGGITPLLDRTGAAERTTGRRFHPDGVATVPAPQTARAQEMP